MKKINKIKRKYSQLRKQLYAIENKEASFKFTSWEVEFLKNAVIDRLLMLKERLALKDIDLASEHSIKKHFIEEYAKGEEIFDRLNFKY